MTSISNGEGGLSVRNKLNGSLTITDLVDSSMDINASTLNVGIGTTASATKRLSVSGGSTFDSADVGTFTLGGTEVTATAAELNILDSATVTTSELNILDGATLTTSELNLLDGVTWTLTDYNSLTATAAELNLLDGVTWTLTDYNSLTATAAELNHLDGVTSPTGSGALVLGSSPTIASPTLTTPNIGTPSAGNLSNCTADGTNEVGFKNIPPVGTKTGSYTLTVSDVGKYVQVGTGGSITIPDATFSEGDVISVYNNTTGDVTITCTISTAYIAGQDADKASVTLFTRGVATILFISGTLCVMTGNVS